MGIVKFIQSFKMSIKSILSNKGRSALTMLGIIIGCASVIVLTGIGGGATKSITDSISEMGVNKITVSMTRGRNSSRFIDIADMEEYLEENPDLVQYMSPYISQSSTVKRGTINGITNVEGCGIDYEHINNLELASGRFLSDFDVENRRKVCIVGSYQVVEYFDGLDPVGQEIKINGESFEIIGVYDETGDSTEMSGDNKITIPYTTAMRFFKTKNIQTFYFWTVSKDVVEQVTNDLEAYITKKLGTDEGFSVSNLTTLLDTMDEMMGIMTTMLAGIAAISLVVGGIGIMNIMTVSVSERTREIGIRKAIGARTTDILLQFLIEAVVLSGLGGVIGIITGIGIGTLVSKITVIVYITQKDMVIMSFMFSLAVGVIFGITPARKAARLNPIEALRSE